MNQTNRNRRLPDPLTGGRMDISVGEILEMKKPHPCGSFDWQVLRVGMDFKLRCLGCGHEIMVPRAKIEKRIKKRKTADAIKQPGKGSAT